MTMAGSKALRPDGVLGCSWVVHGSSRGLKRRDTLVITHIGHQGETAFRTRIGVRGVFLYMYIFLL